MTSLSPSYMQLVSLNRKHVYVLFASVDEGLIIFYRNITKSSLKETKTVNFSQYPQ